MNAHDPFAGDTAQSQFATLCLQAKCYPQKAEYDRNGWDFLVEIPPEEHDGPAEEGPGVLSVYVQVKSTTDEKPSTDLKLSNALKMSESSSPWFLVLFHNPPNGTPRVLVKHVWKDFIFRALRSVRKADLKGHRRKLNKKKLIVSFSDSDDHGQGPELFRWMKETILAHEATYAAEKKSLFDTVGREDHSAIGTFTVHAESGDELERGFLGLNPLKLSSFELIPTRFDMPDHGRSQLMTGGTLTISPTAVAVLTVKFRLQGAAEVVSCVGKIYKSDLFEDGVYGARLETPFGNVLFRRDKTASIQLGLNPDGLSTMRDLEGLARIQGWLREKAVGVEIWDGSKLVLAFTLQASASTPIWWTRIADVARRWIAEGSGALTFKPSDLNAAGRKLIAFEDILSANTLRMIGEYDGIPVDKATGIVISITATLADTAISAMLTWRLKSMSLTENDKQKFVFDTPVVESLHIGPSLDEQGMKKARDAFVQQLERRTDTVFAAWDIVGHFVDQGPVDLLIHHPDEEDATDQKIAVS